MNSPFFRPPHTLFPCAGVRQVWRDVLLTITTRDMDVIGVAPVNRWGAAARQAVRPMSEGTILRLLYTLEALYPCVLARTRTQFTWRLMPEVLLLCTCVRRSIALRVSMRVLR